MKNYFLPLLVFILLMGCKDQPKGDDSNKESLNIVNTSNADRSEVIYINLGNTEKESLKKLKPGAGRIGAFAVELLDDNQDGSIDGALAEVRLSAKDSLSLDFTQWEESDEMNKKTQAEISIRTGGEWQEREYIGGTFKNIDYLRVPDPHTDHSYFIRYEGPGWENELIGYRFYLDWRNAIDIFGKKVDTLVLQKVGQDGFDSYHEQADWGMDILKVGPSLGLGSIGLLNDNGVVEHFEKTDSVIFQITRNGYLGSGFTTTYYGWETSAAKVDLESLMTIEAGDRATKHEIKFSKGLEGFCTGIVKHPEAEYFKNEEGQWGYIATFGQQTLFEDNLGMAVFYRIEEAKKLKEDDEFSYLVEFKNSETITYHFLGAWEQEPGGITSRESFEELLNDKLLRLNEPLMTEW